MPDTPPADDAPALGAEAATASGDLLTQVWDVLGPWAEAFRLEVGHVPWSARALVALAALVLLTRGAALRRDAPRVAVLVCGAVLAAGVLAASGPVERLVVPTAAAGVLALGAAGALWAERLNLRLGLAVVGLLVGVALTLAGVTASGVTVAPWVPWAVGAAAAAIVPWIFETVPRVTTPVVGALGLAWAVGLATSLPALVGVAAAGLLLQVFTQVPDELDLDPVTGR